MPNVTGGWGSWSRHVLAQIEANHEDHAEFRKTITNIRLDINSLKTKAAIVGAIAGLVMSVIGGTLVYFITRG
jgi:hypothetical protein